MLGIGDASGMFPIDSETLNYDQSMLKQFGELTVSCKYSWKLPEILPEVLTAGEAAGTLTESGARRLDPSGVLQSGIMFCPPEGDAGTGMTATNSVGAGTGNVSAGTSVFAMVVLEKRLKNAYRQIDMVATPAGRPVAMVHCNNCTGDLNAWVQLFLEYSERLQVSADPGEVYQAFYREAAKGEPDCGGVVVCNYLAGEPVANLEEGYPMVLRVKKQPFTLPNFCRASLYSATATLKMGMDILAEEEVGVNRLMGHGGLFRNGDIGAEILAAAVDTAISTMGTAVMEGPYGMALLAAYARDRKKGEGLEEFLSEQVFARSQVTETKPDAVNVAGFRNYMKYFKVMLKAEKTAVDNLKQEGRQNMLKDYEFWFVVGSQLLYGAEVLDTVRERAEEMAARLSQAPDIPCRVVYKITVKDDKECTEIMRQANQDDRCAGVITWCHTFSPSKMWIEGCSFYRSRGGAHFATQYNRKIPNLEIDMDFMNLNQSAHGDRENCDHWRQDEEKP